MTTAMISIAGVVLVLCAAGAAAASTAGASKSFPVKERRLFAIRIIGYQEVKWDLSARTPGACAKYANWEGKGDERLDFTMDEHYFIFDANLAMGRGKFNFDPSDPSDLAKVHLSYERRATQTSTDCGQTASWPTDDCGTTFHADSDGFPWYYDTATNGGKTGLDFTILDPSSPPYFACPLGLNYLSEAFGVFPFFDFRPSRAATITFLSLPLDRLLGLKENGKLDVPAPDRAHPKRIQGEVMLPSKKLCGTLIDLYSFHYGHNCRVAEGRIYWLVTIRRVK